MNPATALPLTPAATRREAPSRVRGVHDPWLLLAIATLAALGIVMVASSSIAVAIGNGQPPLHYLHKQLVFLALGVVFMGVLAHTELQRVERQHLLLLVLAVAAVVAVFLPGMGMQLNGARRWLNLGVASFQPVELVKFSLVVYLAGYLVRHRAEARRHLFGALKPVLVTGVFCGLLLEQRDFGSGVLLVSLCVGMLWLGGVRVRDLLVLGASLVPLSAALAFSAAYRSRRFASFLDPWMDPFEGGFQLVQSLIAIGRGEWLGVGLGASVQKLSYLPEAHSDFIFAVIAEELGLVGALVVLALYALLVVRALVIGLRGVQLGQHFAGYVAFGVAIVVGLQALVSISVNLGVLPTTGLTLPLISAGGSSLVMTCALLGLLLRASYEVSRAERQRQRAARVSTDAGVPAPEPAT